MKRFSGIFSGPKASFQILSDLHLDYEAQYLSFHVPVSSPNLILAGNIGRLIDYDLYLSFLIRRCRQYEKIFLVLGALEFHGLALMDGLQLARRLEKESVLKGKLEVLYRTRCDLPELGVTLLGCTLWSKIPEAAEAAVVKKTPEFDQSEGIKDWSIAKHNDEHTKDIRWLLDQVHDPKAVRNLGASQSTSSSQLVVVTAFAPDLREALDPWQVNTPWASAFGTELLGGMDWNSVHLWICGTTGRTVEFKKNGVRVVSNQRGRADEHVNGILDDRLSEKKKRGLFDVTKIVKV